MLLSDGSEPGGSLAASLSMLPADRFPLTLGVAGELSNYGSDAHYTYALRQMITGVGAVEGKP